MDEGTIIEFRGRLAVRSFAEFARHRAARLSLGLTVVCERTDAAAYRLTGPADLIDAFEMAMSLGPADCLVEDVLRPGNEAGRETDTTMGGRFQHD